MSDFEIRGADQVQRLSKALKAAGETGLRKELNKGLRQGAKPLIPKARAAARGSKLPNRGGLAARLGKSAFRIQVRTGREPGVRIVAAAKGGAARLLNDHGRVRHPVFGQDVWVSQSVPEAKGWFEDEMRKEAPSVRPELERAMERVAQEVVRRARR